jgi:hypothetical protein
MNEEREWMRKALRGRERGLPNQNLFDSNPKMA